MPAGCSRGRRRRRRLRDGPAFRRRGTADRCILMIFTTAGGNSSRGISQESVPMRPIFSSLSMERPERPNACARQSFTPPSAASDWCAYSTPRGRVARDSAKSIPCASSARASAPRATRSSSPDGARRSSARRGETASPQRPCVMSSATRTFRTSLRRIADEQADVVPGHRQLARAQS